MNWLHDLMNWFYDLMEWLGLYWAIFGIAVGFYLCYSAYTSLDSSLWIIKLSMGVFCLFTAVLNLIHIYVENRLQNIESEDINARTITVDEIFVGRSSWNTENGLDEREEGQPGLKLDKDGMTVYSSIGDTNVSIHGKGIYVSFEDEETSESKTTVVLADKVCVTRHPPPADVGGRGAGGEARLYVSENGARVDVFDYGPFQWAAGLFANLHEGRVSVYKDGGETEGRLKKLEQMMDDSGRDEIKVYAVDLKGDTDNGGSVNVYNDYRGYSDEKPNSRCASMDKNGYRFR